MRFFASLVADHPKMGWLILLALCIPPLMGFAGFRTSEAVREDWMSPEAMQEIKALDATFSFKAPLLLVLESDDFFTANRVAAMWDAVGSLRQLPSVRQLVWMGDLPEVNLRRRVTPLLPGGNDEPPDDVTAERLQAAKERLLQHPLARSNLISEDGKALLFLLNITGPQDGEPGRQSDIDEIRQLAISKLSPVGINTNVTGVLALKQVHEQALDEDHIRIQLISYGLVTVLSFVIFRRPVAILIAGIGPTMGVVWTLGWLSLFGQSGNELAKIILPVLIMMIGFTDGVHMVIRIRQQRASGKSPKDAAYDAVMSVGPACFLTSLTTAIGFGSLMLSDAEIIAGFGRVSAIGVVLTFFSVVLITPLLSNSWLGRKMHVSETKDPLFRLMSGSSGIVSFASRNAKFVATTGILLTAGFLYCSSQLIPDDRLSDRVPQTASEWQTMKRCDELFGGTRYVRIEVSWTEETSRADLWDTINACEQLLQEEELVGRAISIRTCLSIFNVAKAQERSILAAQLPENVSRQFHRPDLRRSQIVARLQDLGIAKFEPVFERLRGQLRKLEASDSQFTYTLTSDVELEGRVIRDVVGELVMSLALASVVIFFVLAIAFRSLRIGLISILPNAMPLAASGTLRLFLSESLDLASACSFAICLGIAVDDTIHYLIHFQRERANGKSPLEANRNTYVTVGSALLMTSVVMTSGLGAVLTSRLPPHVNFAAMGCATLVMALIADLLFLPAMLSLFPGPGSGDDKAQDASTANTADVDDE